MKEEGGGGGGDEGGGVKNADKPMNEERKTITTMWRPQRWSYQGKRMVCLLFLQGMRSPLLLSPPPWYDGWRSAHYERQTSWHSLAPLVAEQRSSDDVWIAWTLVFRPRRRRWKARGVGSDWNPEGCHPARASSQAGRRPKTPLLPRQGVLYSPPQRRARRVPQETRHASRYPSARYPPGRVCRWCAASMRAPRHGSLEEGRSLDDLPPDCCGGDRLRAHWRPAFLFFLVVYPNDRKTVTRPFGSPIAFVFSERRRRRRKASGRGAWRKVSFRIAAVQRGGWLSAFYVAFLPLGERRRWGCWTWRQRTRRKAPSCPPPTPETGVVPPWQSQGTHTWWIGRRILPVARAPWERQGQGWWPTRRAIRSQGATCRARRWRGEAGRAEPLGRRRRRRRPHFDVASSAAKYPDA